MKHSDLGLAYLAAVYSKWTGGDPGPGCSNNMRQAMRLEDAFIEAAKLAAKLMLAGVKVYSPIAHTHPLAIHGRLDPLDHSIWLPFDEAMLTVCDTLIVAQMDGWQESRGIAHEVAFFETAGKPIFDLDPDSLQMTRRRDPRVDGALDRIAELDEKIAAAPGWGAAVSVMNEERRSLTRFVASRTRALPVTESSVQQRGAAPSVAK